ncbi:MAG: sugar ABC transporter ATP-binding protein [Rhodococcus sp. (in: high G+C Gram-positive bacteria)]|uniref:sugar ABC transporter ATP-binding protein n=1 Tax=Rhodococcus sp. TaxID=1831 RepID=UPI00120C9712|nr:sugar ABC transporter ATP-binding protein [Rhodococcus sp. (in: high G+C Gram-positive bacteria)]RZL23102.1 MAG: sugar ABC transporter ATP-binding protein [Rhodococcus sp. (in: high G+C Gram-positive bacteria)]
MNALDIRGLSKTFSGHVVLHGVDLAVKVGEVHALVGQNGSGKSTLIKILAGYHSPDRGAKATVLDRELELGSAAAADRLNVRFVHQDLGLVNDLSITENIMLGRLYPKRFGVKINWGKARQIARDCLARTGPPIDVNRSVGEFGIAERTRIAIARALPDNDDPALIVLDEPTAALPARDVEALFDTIRSLTVAGNSVILVSHHLDEILGVSDSITVLRDGVKVASVATSEVDHDTLTNLIIGTTLDKNVKRPRMARSDQPANVHITGLRGTTLLEFSADIRPGEILGVAGLTGSGREEVAALTIGREHRSEGTVTIDGTAVSSGDPIDALSAGMAWICGERARYGVFSTMSLGTNVTISDLSLHTRAGRLDRSRERAEVAQWIADLGIVASGPDATMTTLSGGNQQKVLVARALRLEPMFLVLDDPTAGIDIGAREQVHGIIADHADASMSVLITSTDSEELARLCDRVLVLSRGHVIAELHRGVDLDAPSIDHAQVAGASA